jgi:hypothetical protein
MARLVARFVRRTIIMPTITTHFPHLLGIG